MGKNLLIDSHAHLSMFNNLEEVLVRAENSGILKIVNVSTCSNDWKETYEIANKYSYVYWSFGLHPHNAEKIDEFLKEAENIDRKKCVAIGETGLDFHYMFSKKENQIEAFKQQILLAKNLNLPLIIHCRKAFDEVYEILKKIDLSKRSAVMHCFTGDLKDAKNALDLGLKISFSGIITFKNATELREVLRSIPLNSVLIETDCPFLSPIPKRGQKNEPAFLSYTAKYIAKLLDKPFEEITEIFYSNSLDFFGL